jgi:Raf kinase inhibitor-like YbhB/YbcL family protein
MSSNDIYQMVIQSNDIKNNETIPIDFTRYGSNNVPHLSWSNVPENTVELVMICYDPIKVKTKKGLYEKNWLHWVTYDINPIATKLETGKFKNGVNDFKESKYDGPQPPAKTGVHEYHFILFALNQKSGLEQEYTSKDFICYEDLMTILTKDSKVITKSEIVGLYENKE